MKKIITITLVLGFAPMLFAQAGKIVPASQKALSIEQIKKAAQPAPQPFKHTASFNKITELEFEGKGGILTVGVGPNKTATVSIEMDDKNGCSPLILQEKKTLKVEVKRVNPSALCLSKVDIMLPAKTELDIEAVNTDITIGAFTKELDLDVRNSKVKIEGFEGKMEVENKASYIEAVGVFKPLEVESLAGVSHFTWTKKKSFNVEIKGDGEISFTVPEKVTKVPVKDAFMGSLIIKQSAN